LNYLEKNKREDFESLDNPYGKLSIEIILDGFGQGMIPAPSMDDTWELVRLGYRQYRDSGEVDSEYNKVTLVAHAARELQGQLDILKWEENPNFFASIVIPAIEKGLNKSKNEWTKRYRRNKRGKSKAKATVAYGEISATTKAAFQKAFNGLVPSDEKLKKILTDRKTSLIKKVEKVSNHMKQVGADNRGTWPPVVWTKNDQDNQLRKSMLNGESCLEVKDIGKLKKQYGLQQNDLEIKELKKLYADLLKSPDYPNRFSGLSTEKHEPRKYDFDLQSLNEEFIKFFYNNINQGYIPQGLSETPKTLKNKDTNEKILRKVLEKSFQSLSEAISNTKRVIDPDITAKLLHSFHISAYGEWSNQEMFDEIRSVCKIESKQMPPSSAKHYMAELWKHLKQWELPYSPDFEDAHWILDRSIPTDDVYEGFFTKRDRFLPIARARWARLIDCINKTYENGIRRHPEVVRKRLGYLSENTFSERENIQVKDPTT